MKKKIVNYLFIAVFIVLIIVAGYNIYKAIVTGEQTIKISTSEKAFTNSDLFVSVIAQENGAEIESKTKIKLLDSNRKKVKDVEVSYDGSNATLSIPEVEQGNYYIEAKVSSKAGKDTVQKEIYITDGKQENITITMDKGIYKPGDEVNFRALLTSKDNDTPITKDVNVSIFDGNDNKVYNENVKTSEYGIISGKFTLANELNSGIYKLVVTTNTNSTTKEFKVNPYVTPKYDVTIDLDKESYLVGDTATINLNAKYFFGEPAADTEFTVYIDDKKIDTVKADKDGNAKLEYKISEAKSYTVKAEAVDTSNYYVEETTSFSAGTDIFEIEFLPEYGGLVEGIQNEVYVFTKEADGTPVKTYLTVSSGEFVKQVATDENGIGRFVIDADLLSSSSSNYRNTSSKNKTFNVEAENMNGDKVNKEIYFSTVSKNIVVSTDKVKYNQGEDIKIKMSSLREAGTKNIYLFKNDKLLKMISTDSEETTVNLEDNYGLIDIYVTQKNANEKDSYKRTIFIKPTKALNINISTDKEEYRPGDNIKITFDTKDETNSNVDSALLVSMLDNSILELANNDISIDNIKLALSDIEFSNDLDAATLYSCIVDDESEQTMMGLLLKQGDRDINISETSIRDTDTEFYAIRNATILVIIILLIVVVYCIIKFSKFREFLKHAANVLVYTQILAMFIEFLLSGLFDFYIRGGLALLILLVAASITTYVLWVSKINKYIYKTSIYYIISLILIYLCNGLLYELDIDITVILCVIVVILLGLIVAFKIDDTRKKKHSKIIAKMRKETISIAKYIGAAALAIIIGILLNEITDADYLSYTVMLVCIYVFNYLFNRGKENKVNEETKKEINKKVIIILAAIGAFTIFVLIVRALNSYSDSLLYDGAEISTDYFDNGPDTVDSLFDKTADGTSATDGVMGTQSGSLFDFSSIFDGFDKTTNSSKVDNNDETNSIEDNMSNVDTTETVVDDNVRNIFLESMCFVPELVTTNGNATLDLELSDNITTWTIQVVGNTKDGKVGYGMMDNVKVFKEFFVDFELPTNLVKDDEISIPVTVYNYTDSTITTTLKIQEDNWFDLKEENEYNVTINAKETKLIYVPIVVKESGNHKFRVEATSNSLTDIVEKELSISPKGYKVEKVVSTGNLDDDISEDILILEDIVENSASAKVKIYASPMAQNVEGMENIFKMPSGCFEQVSSSLYPNILALKYMQDNQIVDEEIKNKALEYISSGYQKLLTYEVKGEDGGYSLYGKSPAETVLTAYGLMELTDLKEVYSVDESVINDMNKFLYEKQNIDGSFKITGYSTSIVGSREELALNAYIIWALSESDPNNSNLSKSIDYLKNNLDKVDDNYTLALIANALANVDDKEVKDVIERLISNINIEDDKAYITANITDYYGARGYAQTNQTTALTSMALSKTSENENTNKLLINYLISNKDVDGTWNSTQATILSLKALNECNDKSKLDNQTITVRINSEEQKIEINDNPLEYYELTFSNLGKENKLNIDIESGSAYYEVVEEYYVPYEKVETSEDNIDISTSVNTNKLNINDILKTNIKLTNNGEDRIYNGMVTISIPQGFTVIEESLMKLENDGKIEKYETSYTSINLYLRDFEVSQLLDLDLEFRASYPVNITGLAVKAYDYYNPQVEGKSMPIKIEVND